MIALGIEGTAHTFGVGLVEGVDDPAIRANHTRMYRPEEGGIHPREAARHHAEVAGDAVRAGLDEAGLDPAEVDLVAFSRGPGLGPCLRTAATAARALSLRLDVPLVGVNHCVAHQEIGRAVTPAEDPVLLYASGANTQVIGYAAGRYRLYGETLDVGVGNMLDKFAREAGLPFPGGPAIEEEARASDALLELPYTVKGMDMAFSGLLTAAIEALDGAPMADVANSLQETAFATLVEVAERALAHAGKDEVVLGGGVACNDRLREMTETMARERGADAYAPDPPLCLDNGAMIAHTGLLARRAGEALPVEDSAIDQGWRTDEAPLPWRDGEAPTPRASADEPDQLARGAEAVVTEGTYLGREVVRKCRLPKGYRHPDLDRRLRLRRARLEARLLREAREAGVRTPLVYAVTPDDATLVLERLPGPTLREALEAADAGEARRLLRCLGRTVARLHGAGLVHGDLTTSNVLLAGEASDRELALIDLGLSGRSGEAEEAGVDLRVLLEALEATHAGIPHEPLLEGYRREGGREGAVEKLEEIAARGRYKEQVV